MKIKWTRAVDGQNHKEHEAKIKTSDGIAVARVTLFKNLGQYNVDAVVYERMSGLCMKTKYHKKKSYGSYTNFHTAMKHFRKAQCETQRKLKELE